MTTKSHFRDCKEWMDEGLGMSTTSNEAVKLYDHALHQLMSHTPDLETGGIMGAIEKMLCADAEFAMGKVLKAGFQCMSAGSRLDPKVKEIGKDMNRMVHENSTLNDREKLHCAAIIEWTNENVANACKKWEEILFAYPCDTLALSFSYLGYLTTGKSAMLRDSVGRILNQWNDKDPWYGYILNRYAFGLEETNLFDQAERVTKEGLGLIPNDSWGIHTNAHIYESTCQFSKGVDFLCRTAPDWSVNNTLACHNYWHLGLYYIEKAEYENALTLYDDHIAPAFKKSGIAFNLNDGCQLLQRFEFEGVDVGDRWDDLYATYKPCNMQHMSCYNDSHMLLSFLKSKIAKNDGKSKDDFLTSVKEYVNNSAGDNNRLTREVGLGLFDAFIAFTEERYSDAVELLFPLKHEFIRLGGSHAQRDMYDQFLLNACIRSSVRKHHEIGRGLIHERKLLKPVSPLTDRMLEKLVSAHF
ncbi:tetratricopeptide repeat protein 38-like [Hydractinia symbiolongicarpus]|uniref:tetratricopeptide repeat protein 38-like n=1 Tax=Hydractinia symbiolongicarpus TaxID=13093 RepID=UPI00254F8C15|nr:tetratricopeptide repeat protein 38-like [Hydractinia symbiolongicarpus]